MMRHGGRCFGHEGLMLLGKRKEEGDPSSSYTMREKKKKTGCFLLEVEKLEVPS